MHITLIEIHLFNQYILILGSFSVPMAVGDPSSGKSTSLQIINKLFGGKFISQTSGESLSTELMKTSIPICWDDPTHPTTLKKVLVSTFRRGRQTWTSDKAEWDRAARNNIHSYCELHFR